MNASCRRPAPAVQRPTHFSTEAVPAFLLLCVQAIRYHATQVDNGDEGFSLAISEFFDLIVMDIFGFTATRTLRSGGEQGHSCVGGHSSRDAWRQQTHGGG